MRLTKAQKKTVQSVTSALLGEFRVGDYVEIVRGNSKQSPHVLGARGRIVRIIPICKESMEIGYMQDYYQAPFAYQINPANNWCVGAQHMRHIIAEGKCNSPEKKGSASQRSRRRSHRSR